jgi:deoxyribodipyrimidine photo-lyase
MSYHVVWFKKDLRVSDHAALTEAVQRGKTVALVMVEPEWLQSPQFDSSHYVFFEECIRELKEDLMRCGIPLMVATGEAVEVLQKFHEKFGIASLHSHEETGLYWTYQRDIRVKKWTRHHNIPWYEYRQFGVVRALKNRDRWAEHRARILYRPLLKPPRQPWPREFETLLPALPTLRDLNLPPSLKRNAQKGGRKAGEKALSSFLEERGFRYLDSLSSPSRSITGCGRISPYLTWGSLSMTEILAHLHAKKDTLGNQPFHKKWRSSLEHFESRLAWHCHFIQKLESEPEIEFENMNRSFDGMRENEFNEEYFEAWCKGQTGFPIIDAGMRALHETGWINFRMRATLMSFASYQLWLHWRRPAQFLARHFIDFEPGIHYSQVQMQSGVTGINTIRIYSPKKQAQEKDSSGEFIRKYCPELSAVPDADLAEPHLMPPLLASSMGFVPGQTYPEPMVDPEASYQRAKERIFEWHQKSNVKAEAKKVYLKHGSRDRKRQTRRP